MSVEFYAVDWGLSRRRVFHIAADGRIVSHSADDRGIANARDFAAEIAALRREAGDLPILLTGMIGSRRGWVEVPHADAPADVAGLAAGCVEAAPGIWIVPGLVFPDPVRPDQMRGEEVSVFGALADVGNGLACLPGALTRWVEVEGGCIMRLRTVMTGDLLEALRARSVLSDLLDHAPQCDEVFAEGVDHGLEQGDLTAELFSVRARVMTGAMTAADGASRISGLLIGADVRAGLGRSRADVVPLIGTPALCERYALALRRAGRESTFIDGDAAFVAGARTIMAARISA